MKIEITVLRNGDLCDILQGANGVIYHTTSVASVNGAKVYWEIVKLYTYHGYDVWTLENNLFL